MSIVCCFGCLSLFGCRDPVCRKLAFFPPRPAMYCIEETERHGRFTQTMWLQDEHETKHDPYSAPNFYLHTLRTSRKQRIVCMVVRCEGAEFTILFSHGNATDLGMMRNHLIDMAVRLKVNVVCYDYCGYGHSTGKASVKNTKADIEAVYKHIVNVERTRPQNIILYGQSIGSGPTLYLGSKYPNIGGVVLHSAMMSGLRVVKMMKKTKWFDIYPNIDVIKKIRCPLLLIHGQADLEIGVEHGRALSQATPNPFGHWIVEGGGHNNIEMNFRDEFFVRISDFLQFLSKRGKNEERI